MLARLRRQVAVECRQLNELVRVHRPLLDKCLHTDLEGFEVSALAAMLHSFYSGVENIFKRIALEIEGEIPAGSSWHSELLERMARPMGSGPPVISEQLRDSLKEYLQFRHVFRSAYSFLLRWDKMAPLALGCETTLRRLEAELASFLSPAEG